MTPRHVLALLLLVGGFLILMAGLLWHGWGFTEIGALFFWIGIVVPVAGGLFVTEMIANPARRSS